MHISLTHVTFPLVCIALCASLSLSVPTPQLAHTDSEPEAPPSRHTEMVPGVDATSVVHDFPSKLEATVVVCSPPQHPSMLYKFISGYWIVVATIVITLPWAIVAIWDAIDSSYRNAGEVAARLLMSTLFLGISYSVGIVYTSTLFYYTIRDEVCGRQNEAATILVLFCFNLYHVARNVRGWSQFYALRKLNPFFTTIQSQFQKSFEVVAFHDRLPSSSQITFEGGEGGEESFSDDCDATTSPHACIGGCHLFRKTIAVEALDRLRISNRLVDNDWTLGTPVLHPFRKIEAREMEDITQADNEWAIAMWRAWWTQDTSLPGWAVDDLSPKNFACRSTDRFASVEGLDRTDPSAFRADIEVVNPSTGARITSKEEWLDELRKYGGDEGQQDTHGNKPPTVMQATDESGIAVLVFEKTRHLANRMSALWYNTARFEEVYEERAFDLATRTFSHILFPRWNSWISIARDISMNLSGPVALPSHTIRILAGELASASVILVRFEKKFGKLVDIVYRDGLNARWTFGWSGLLACFSHLWTPERIYVVLLNGLSLLALNSVASLRDLDVNVRAMLCGYAAYAVSERAVGREIAEDRTAELLKRYSNNLGLTSRGAGLRATRLACRVLNLPPEASHMDGLPAFSTGWVLHFLKTQSGSQPSDPGQSHDEIERLEGSSNVWRYPASHV